MKKKNKILLVCFSFVILLILLVVLLLVIFTNSINITQDSSLRDEPVIKNSQEEAILPESTSYQDMSNYPISNTEDLSSSTPSDSSVYQSSTSEESEEPSQSTTNDTESARWYYECTDVYEAINRLNYSYKYGLFENDVFILNEDYLYIYYVDDTTNIQITYQISTGYTEYQFDTSEYVGYYIFFLEENLTGGYEGSTQNELAKIMYNAIYDTYVHIQEVMGYDGCTLIIPIREK